MERYAETQRTSGTKSSPSRHLSVPPAGHVLSSVHYCPFSCSFSPPSPAFAFLLFLLPDIPILPSFYAALSLLLLLLLVGFCPCQPPRPTDPLPPLPPLSSSSNLPPCLSFSSSTTTSRATDSPLCLSVFFHSHRLVPRAFSSACCERKRQLTVVQVTGRKRRADDAVEGEAGFNRVAAFFFMLAQICGERETLSHALALRSLPVCLWRESEKIAAASSFV